MVACQTPLSMGFSRQEYWSGLPSPLTGDLPDPGIKPMFSASPALAGGFPTTSATWYIGTKSGNSLAVTKVCDSKLGGPLGP